MVVQNPGWQRESMGVDQQVGGRQAIYLSICVSAYLSIYLSIFLSIHASIYLSLSVPVVCYVCPKVVQTGRVFNVFDFQICFAQQKHALFQYLNFKKGTDAGVFCTFLLGHVLGATMSCTCSTNQIQKVVWQPQF